MTKEIETEKIIRNKVQDLFRTYKGILTFILPIFLALIVGSVITNNKPEIMGSTLIASGLANLIALGFITNIFIVFGLEYIDLKDKIPRGKELTIGTIKLAIWNSFLGLFNFLYLMFLMWMFTDVTHFMTQSFFTGNNIDWWGVLLSLFQFEFLTISMTLFFAHFFDSKKHYVILSFLYFLAFGYLAGGMFGPGATYWMSFPSYFLPHTYVTHFLSASFTNGYYDVAHLFTKGDIYKWVNDGISDKGYAKFIFWIMNHKSEAWSNFNQSIFIQHGSSIWDMSVWKPYRWADANGDSWKNGDQFYNNFYQVNALNVFVPITISASLSTVFWIVKNQKPKRNHEGKEEK